jgi:hypothetical protein
LWSPNCHSKTAAAICSRAAAAGWTSRTSTCLLPFSSMLSTRVLEPARDAVSGGDGSIARAACTQRSRRCSVGPDGRAQIKAELFAHHASEEAAHRMLLPLGRAHDGRNRHPLRSTQHREHASLFRAWPAFARGASFGLRLARLMPRANGRLRCNGSPLARGDDFACSCFDFGPVGSRANALSP